MDLSELAPRSPGLKLGKQAGVRPQTGRDDLVKTLDAHAEGVGA